MRQKATDGLTDQQRKAILALASGSTVTQAAEQVGVARQTFYRWAEEPEFTAAYNRVRTEAVAAAQEELRNLYAAAVQTMKKILEGDTTSPETKLRAAKAVLEFVKPTEGLGPTKPEEVSERQERYEQDLANFKKNLDLLRPAVLSEPTRLPGLP